MAEDQQIQDLEEILNILDTNMGHFADKLAKWTFKKSEFLRGLVFILRDDLVQHLDFERAKIVSPNIVGNTLQELVSDMVFTVPFRDTSKGTELTIYILLEHQSTSDRMMGYRLLSYMCQIWHAQLEELANAGVKSSQHFLHPIVPIVFYTGDRQWKTPVSLNAVMDVPEKMTPYVPSFKTHLIGVKHIDTDELTQIDHPFVWLMTVLQKEFDDEKSMQETLEKALTQLDTVKDENPILHRNAMIYLSLIVRCRRHASEQTPLLRMINTRTDDEEVKSIIMTGAEALIQQGKAEGLEQGKAEGLEQGRINEKRTAVLKIVRYRFAERSDTVLNEITAIEDLGHLDDLFDQALTAETFEDIDFSKNGK